MDNVEVREMYETKNLPDYRGEISNIVGKKIDLIVDWPEVSRFGRFEMNREALTHLLSNIKYAIVAASSEDQKRLADIFSRIHCVWIYEPVDRRLLLKDDELYLECNWANDHPEGWISREQLFEQLINKMYSPESGLGCVPISDKQRQINDLLGRSVEISVEIEGTDSDTIYFEEVSSEDVPGGRYGRLELDTKKSKYTTLDAQYYGERRRTMDQYLAETVKALEELCEDEVIKNKLSRTMQWIKFKIFDSEKKNHIDVDVYSISISALPDDNGHILQAAEIVEAVKNSIAEMDQRGDEWW